jgi:hypothetical protein
MSASETEKLAKDLESPLLVKQAEALRLKEQSLMQHKIGKVTLKVIDGEYYHYRPHGWVKITSLTDIIFEDVQELPINERVRSYYPVRIECQDETHKVNVSFPIRNDLTKLVLDERIARALAVYFNGGEATVYIGHGNEITTHHVNANGEVDDTWVSGIPINELGGAQTVRLEI